MTDPLAKRESVNWHNEVVPTVGSILTQFCMVEMMFSFIWQGI